MSTLPERVYQLVAQIPKGKVATYGQLALLAGSPRASRIVGAAMYRAPSGLPCHRVLGREGALCGFRLGLDAKRRLLTLEGIGWK